MVKTFNVDRTKGGTFSFKLDAQGNYTLQKDGFEGVNTLNLPELKAEATKTTTTQDTKTASAQTKEAFGDVQPFYYQGGGRDASQYTTEYEMTKDKSLDTSQPMVAGDTFAQARQKMTTDEAYRGEPMTTDKVYQDAIMRGESGVKYMPKRNPLSIRPGEPGQPINEKSIRVNRQGTEFPRPEAGTIDQMAANQDPNRFLPMSGPQKQSPYQEKQSPYQDAIMRGERGVKYEKPAVPQKTTELTQTALKQINTASNTLSKTLGGFLKGGGIVGGVVRSIAGPPTATQTHAKEYFNVTGGNVDGGRIAGNPATDLYAGMNRVSAFGNLEKAGAKRISTREKTAAKNVGKWSKEKMDKFNATTNNMKNQQDSYVRDKHEAVARDAVKKGADPMNPSEMRAASIKASNEKGNSGNGGGNTRVICTELHKTGEMSTVDWIRDTRFTFKTLTQKHVKGYLFWAVPTVKLMKKYPLYRKIWKHLAQHRANDIAWRLNEGKFDLLGRIYAGIGETLCWLIGNCVSDKHIKEFNIKNWRRV